MPQPIPDKMSGFWQDRDKRRGLLATVLVHSILLLLFFFMGLKYLEPKPEEGILINFGYSEAGSGAVETENPSAEAPQETSNESSSSSASNPAPSEATLTQDLVEAPSVPESEPEETQAEENPQTNSPSRESVQEEPEEQKPQASENLKKLLDKTKNSSTGGGEGETGQPGNQGREDGDKQSKNRKGSGTGNSGDGNYRLRNRQALAKPKPNYPCPEEEGRVVVKIYVNQSGQVIRAVPGEKIPGGLASTTASRCLYQQAEQAALKTTWQADTKAPDLQIGYIIYRFTRQ